MSKVGYWILQSIQVAESAGNRRAGEEARKELDQFIKSNEELTEACEVWLDKYEILQATNKWQPIATAPEDEHILVVDNYVIMCYTIVIEQGRHK